MNPSKKSALTIPRVLVVTPQPFFEERGTPIAVRYVVKALSELGYQIDLIAFPVGREVEIPNVRIHRVANILGIRSVPIGFSLKKLFLDVFLYFKVRKLLKSNHYSYVHAVEEASFIVAIAKHGLDIPLIYDMASSLPEQFKDHPLIGRKPLINFIKISESWIINRAGFIVCSAGLLDLVKTLKKGVKAAEWWFPSVVTEGVNSNAVAQFRKSLQLAAEEKLFVYTGSFSSYQGIDIVFAAISLLGQSKTPVRFLMVGATPEELEKIQAQWPTGSSTNLTVMGRLNREEVGKILLAADALLSPRLFGGNVPLKVFDYMGTGKPIIASDIPAHRAVLDETRALFFENTPDSFVCAINELVRDKEKSALLSKNSLDYANKYLTWQRFRSFIQAMIDCLLKEGVPFTAPPLPNDRKIAAVKPETGESL